MAKRILTWIKIWLGWCPQCGRWFRHGVKRRRQNTAYVEEEWNFVTACEECFEEIESYWEERWAEYYADRL